MIVLREIAPTWMEKIMNKDKVIELYQAIQNSNKERVYEHWHASSLAECPRTQYFKRLGIKPLTKPSAAKVLRWKSGHLMEEAIRPIVEEVYGKTVSNQRFTSVKLDLTGEFDNFVLVGNRLVEIKTVHDMAFIDRNGSTYLKENLGKTTQSTGRVITNWGAKEKPYMHHEIQNHGYVLLLAEEGIQVEGIDYVYISLSGRLCVYSTEVQQELINNAEARLRALDKAWKTKTPPACICDSKHPLYAGVMQWCDYKTEYGCCSLSLLETIK